MIDMFAPVLYNITPWKLCDHDKILRRTSGIDFDRHVRKRDRKLSSHPPPSRQCCSIANDGEPKSLTQGMGNRP